MLAQADSSAAASRPATRAPEPAAQASPRFSPCHLPFPPPTSSAAALPLFYPPLAQPIPEPQAPEFLRATPNSFRWPAKAALGFVAALSRTRSPALLAPVAPRLTRARTTSLHRYKETVFSAARVARPASNPGVLARIAPEWPPAQNI